MFLKSIMSEGRDLAYAMNIEIVLFLNSPHH